jgi:hypothetical protein
VCKRVGDTNTMMAPLLLPCLAALMRALPRCQAKSLLCGYDLLGALLRGVPRDLVAPAGAQIWPVLLRSCTTTPPDRRLVALLDCIANSILALGATVAPHAAPLLRRSLELGLVQLRAAADRARQEASLLAELRAHRPDATATEAADVVQARLGASAVDVDFAIVAIDMCGSVCEALGAQCVAPLGQLPLGDLLREAVACKDASVRQVRALVMFLVFSFFSLGCVWAGRGLVAARVGAAAGAAGGCAAGAAAGQSVRLARVAVHERVLGAGRAVCARPSSRPRDSGGRLATAAHSAARPRRAAAAQRGHYAVSPGALVSRAAGLYAARDCSLLAAPSRHHQGSTLFFLVSSCLPEWCLLQPGPDRERSHEVVLKLLLGSPAVALAQLPRLCALVHSWGAVAMPGSVRGLGKELFGVLAQSPEWAKKWQAVAPEIQQYVQKHLQ